MKNEKDIKKFQAIQIQTTSFCNRNCEFCPSPPQKKEKRLMDPELFRSIIQQLKEMSFRGIISPFLMNEPFSDKRIIQFIEFIRKELPKSYIYITSNGDYLTKDLLLQLEKIGVDDLRINCYDNEEQYQKRRKIIKSIDYKKMKVLSCDIYNGGTSSFNNRAGNVKYNKEKDRSNRSCVRPFQTIYINYLGQVVLCCSDYFFKVVMGDAKKNKLLDVWNNEKFSEYRKRLSTEGRKNLELCKKCDFCGHESNSFLERMKKSFEK